jgi:hypothetical protein
MNRQTNVALNHLEYLGCHGSREKQHCGHYLVHLVSPALTENGTHMMVVLVVAQLVLVGTCTWSGGPAEVERGGRLIGWGVES